MEDSCSEANLLHILPQLETYFSIHNCRYRRRHCEKQIQKLQKKVLDIQQELAVAHSTERKKDLMIEQLDNVERFFYCVVIS